MKFHFILSPSSKKGIASALPNGHFYTQLEGDGADLMREGGKGVIPSLLPDTGLFGGTRFFPQARFCKNAPLNFATPELIHSLVHSTYNPVEATMLKSSRIYFGVTVSVFMQSRDVNSCPLKFRGNNT